MRGIFIIFLTSCFLFSFSFFLFPFLSLSFFSFYSFTLAVTQLSGSSSPPSSPSLPCSYPSFPPPFSLPSLFFPLFPGIFSLLLRNILFHFVGGRGEGEKEKGEGKQRGVVLLKWRLLKFLLMLLEVYILISI